ncbi:unnamed protein product, partial [marine sediment metagenome]
IFAWPLTPLYLSTPLWEIVDSQWNTQGYKGGFHKDFSIH